MGTTHRQNSTQDHIWLSRPAGASNFYADPSGRFAITTPDGVDAARLLRLDAHSAALAFVNGKFEIRGDIFEAIRCFLRQHHSPFRELIFSGLARLEHLRTSYLLGGKARASRDIQFHYDLSNEFYSQFLDSRMIYSSAYFNKPDDTLEEAQRQKLDQICRDLVLRENERFLDVGSGWGGLVVYAAERFWVKAHGCTLAAQQLAFSRDTVERLGLSDRVQVDLRDYRDLRGTYDKIASVGMFEHVGPRRLGEYFKKIYSLLAAGGLFLNRGLIRPQNVTDGADTLFLVKSVFPGSGLVHLADVVREGERAGFEVVGLRDLRTHYAFTCRRWVKNLLQNASACRSLVNERTYRTWVLYLAASSVALENGGTSAAQVLFAKKRQ